MSISLEPVVKKGRGRPRDPQTKLRIMDAARKQFLQHGLGGASLERIAELAGTTRVTVYSHFSSKEALFSAALCDPVTAALDISRHQLDVMEPKAALTLLATTFLRSVTDPASVAQIHVLYRANASNPEAAVSFYAAGPQQLLEEVDKLLTRLISEGVLDIPDSMLAAEQFLALVRGNEQMRALLSLPPARHAQARSKYVSSSVDLFWRGYQPR